jgi:hypothetical protein
MLMHVKQILVRVHGGILGMDRHAPIDVNLISNLIGLPIDRVKPKQYLDDKTKEKAIAEEVKETIGTNRGKKGMIINEYQ